MKKIFFIFVFIFFSLLSFAGELMENLAKKSKSINSVYLEFTQTKLISMLDEKIESNGIIVFSEKGEVRWENKEPFKSIMISDSKTVKNFEFIGGKWKALKQNGLFNPQKFIEQVRRMIMGDFSESQFIAEEKGAQILLTPKNPDLKEHLSFITISVDKEKSQAKSVEIKFANGDISIVKFTKIIENPPDYKNAFIYEPLREYSAK